MVTGKITYEEKQIIKQMREQKKSYNEIAEKLNCKKDRVAHYCRSNGLGGLVAGGGGTALSEEIFEKRFNEKFGNRGFRYHGNYTNSDKPFKLKCLKCGDIIERNAQVLRHNKVLTCYKCVEIRNEIKALTDALQKELDDKYTAIVRNANLIAKKQMRIIMNTREYECLECGNLFKDTRKRKYCSGECSDRYRNRVKDLKRRTRLRENGKIDYSISIEKLINRYKGKCALCGGEVDMNDYVITDEGHHIAGNDYPSIDHALPVAKGGTHTWDNVQLAHRGCNSSKGDNPIHERQGQLVLSV